MVCILTISAFRSWLFTASLVLAVGVLGREGLGLEEHCRASIACLEYFARLDPLARQYSVTVRSILQTTTEHVQRRADRLRSRRKQASSHLFGMISNENDAAGLGSMRQRDEALEVDCGNADSRGHVAPSVDPDEWNIYDADFYALPWINENDQALLGFLQPGRQTLDGSLADIPLFPLDSNMNFQP